MNALRPASSAGLPACLADAPGGPDSYAFPLTLLAFGGLCALATLGYVLRVAFSRQAGEIGGWELRGARQRIAAIARTTLAEGLRAKVGSSFALLLLVALPLFWLTADGDGTIKGRIQMFLSYSLGFSGFVLSLLTIFFSCRSLSMEIAGRQIYAIVSKPIPRWQIVAGKWVGVMVLNAILFGAAGLAAYAGTWATLRRFRAALAGELVTYGAMTPQQAADTVAALERVRGIGREGAESPVIDAFAQTLARSREQVAELLLRLPEQTRVNLKRYDELRRQVLVARAAVGVPLPDFSEEVRKEYRRLQEAGELPEGWDDAKVREQIEKSLAAQWCAVGPGEQNARQWKVRGPPPERGGDSVMSLRFKIHPSGPVPAGDFLGKTLEEDTLVCLWGIGDPRRNYLDTIDAFPVRTTYELEIPTRAVEPDGTVLITFINLDPRQVSAVFDIPNRGLEVLYRVGTFELGIMQACLAMLIPLACLAAFGVCASTFLSFPVGSLILVVLFIIASSIGFVAESLAATTEYVGPNPGTAFFVRKAVVDALGWALSIGDLDPVAALIEGRAVGWGPLWTSFWKFVLVKGLAVFMIAVLVLRRRELAAVMV